MAEIDLTPTEQMASNAKRGLELRRKHKRGGTGVGVARARDISNRKNLSPSTVKRMHSYFARHEVDKKGEGWGEDSAGYIAWLLWGGDAGKSWAARKVEQLERKDENMMSETRKAIMARLGMAAMNDRPGAKARFADNCGTGAGGFKPGNKCGAEDGKGGGKAPESKKPKRKAKTKRTPLAGPKVAKPAKIPSADAMADRIADWGGEDAWWQAGDELRTRTDPQAKALLKEMEQVDRQAEKLNELLMTDSGPKKAVRAKIAKQLDRMEQRRQRIIRDASKTEKTAKRETVEQAGNLLGRTIKAQEAIGYFGALADVRDAMSDLKKRGGAGSGKMRKSLKAMEEEWRGLERETDAINTAYTDMKDQQPVDERQARALKQRAGQLLQRTGDWRKRAQALVGQAKARASRTGDKRLMAAAVRAQKILARRPGPRTRFGFLDRIGRAATALTARPVDTTAPGYAQQVEQARREAVDIVKNYRFLRDKVVARQQAMDNYVKQAAAAIAKSKVAPDIRHFTDQISTAVKAQQMMLMAVKTPFGRKGAKARMSARVARFRVGKTLSGGYSVVPLKADGSVETSVYEEIGFRHSFPTVEAAVAKAKQMQAKYGGTVTMEDKQMASRPGAKAKMGKDRFCDVTSTPLPTKADQRKQEFSHHAPGDRVMVTHDGQEVRGVVMRVMEDGGYIVDMGAKGSARFADSEVSAVREGEKLSAAAGDEAVSEKIRTLVAEGKPQKQAVAIALDMKRRGEL